MKDVSSVTKRNKEILRDSVHIHYDSFKQERLAWDYEKLMSCVDLTIDEIKQIQKDVFVGNTPLLELENITKLVRSISPKGKGARIFLKDEANNPTGSFKDRRASITVREAARLGYPGVITSTSGNYGAAVSSQASRRGIKSIICQEVFDDAGNGQPESLEKARASEAYGAEVQQFTVGPELFTYVILDLLEKTGYFSASLYLPHSIAGIETLGTEIMEQTMEQTGVEPDVVLITHAGGGNFTGTARGLEKLNYKGKLFGITVDLGDLNSHDDEKFARKSFSTGHSGYGFPSLYNPDSVDVPLNAARPLRYMDQLYTVTQGEVYYVTEILAQLEGLQRGPAGNTALAGAISLAQEMDDDQIIVVQESEYTGAGKQHTAQLTFATENEVSVKRGDPSEEVPGKSIIIPESPKQIRAIPKEMDKFRKDYLRVNVQEKGLQNITTEELSYLGEETNQDTDAVMQMLYDLGVTVI